ncbi:hypothetical protein SPRG_03002 [Saprolegnia parasitica CBS 223.65]|uniref:Transmembrane protein n=1 Tax=Saprolegnia parasitica (strain CBS 223.65) TaxID=695850 RepID=A0A067CTE5_SAPPC|nr:hypothetical protein SPRG_03002 [Saprolegnia parasitica CBS 223.65]KDO32525.1 hypothetical protein SPRG_03002 [Saprolegnia parasitica CBS 223.65]|eukprot:XP_012196974.1 hypothetical protein SPRG_03002 [Saprolegnia parasitica CBS 223.65]
MTMLQILFGVDNTQVGTYQYDAPTIPRYLRMHMADPTRQANEIRSMLASGSHIMYMEPDRENASEYTMLAGNCSTYQPSDRLYNESHLLPVLQRVLQSLSSPIDLYGATHAVLIDCDYTGRVFQDTSIFKAYLVDVNLVNMSSIVLQTMVAERSSTHLQTHVGPAIVSTVPMKSFYELPPIQDPVGFQFGLNATSASSYHTAVSFYFPYENATPFHEMHITETLPSNQWAATVVGTNESLVINGYSGYYRNSNNDQVNYIRYVIAMSGNPVRDFVVDLFVSLGHTKDSWAWVQGLVILTISIRIAFTILVAAVVSARYFLATQSIWFPDVFTTIKRYIRIRAFLFVVALVIDRFWALEEYVLTTTFVRYNLLPMFVLGANVRSDFLTLFIVWTDLWATALHLSLPPFVPVALYFVCFGYSNDVVQLVTSKALEEDVLAYVTELYTRNLVDFTETGMNLWTYFALDAATPQQWFMLREFTWFFAPCIGIVAVLLAWKGLSLVHQHCCDKRSRRVQIYQDAAVATYTASAMELASMPCIPEHFLDHFLPSEDGLPVAGLVTKRLQPIHMGPDSFQIDHEFLWGAGWVILHGIYVVRQDDLPRIFTNVVFQASIFKVHCCLLATRPGPPCRVILEPDLTTLPYWNLSWRNLSHLSLRSASVLLSKKAGNEEPSSSTKGRFESAKRRTLTQRLSTKKNMYA